MVFGFDRSKSSSASQIGGFARSKKQAWESTSRPNIRKHISVFRVARLQASEYIKRDGVKLRSTPEGIGLRVSRRPESFISLPPPVRPSGDTLLFLQHPHAPFHRFFVPLPFYETPRQLVGDCLQELLSSWFGVRAGEITPLTNRLVLRTTRGVSCILLLADSLNRFRHIMKNFLRISVFVVLLNRPCCLKESLFGNASGRFLSYDDLPLERFSVASYELSWRIRLNPRNSGDSVKIPVKTDNLGKIKLSHHHSMIRISKRDVLVNV